MYKIGDSVNVLSESAGWGRVHKGNIGIIKHISDNDRYIWIDVPGVTTGWQCTAENLSLIGSTTRVNCQLTNFMQRHKDYIGEGIHTMQRRLKDNEKQLRVYAIQLETCVSPNSKLFTQLKEQLESISMNYPEFKFITKPITIKYFARGLHKTLECPMGQYEVRCDMRPGGIRIQMRPYGQASLRFGDRYHPHVGSGDDPCWGTYSSRVDKVFKDYDIIGIVSLVLEFLSSCDRPGWYTSVLQWYNHANPEQALCLNCEHIVTECSCCDSESNEENDVCTGCGYHEEECACTRCPDNYDRLSGDTFPDDQCGRCGSLRRNLNNGMWECVYNGVAYPEFNTPLVEFTIADSANNRYTTIGGDNGQET